VIFQFLLFLNLLHLSIMKALRIKIVDHVSHEGRFRILMLKDVVGHNLAYQGEKNEAVIQLELHQGEPFLLSLACEDAQYQKFKLSWDRFLGNDEYYFDLSEWGSIK